MILITNYTSISISDNLAVYYVGFNCLASNRLFYEIEIWLHFTTVWFFYPIRFMLNKFAKYSKYDILSFSTSISIFDWKVGPIKLKGNLLTLNYLLDSKPKVFKFRIVSLHVSDNSNNDSKLPALTIFTENIIFIWLNVSYLLFSNHSHKKC